jgi:hypothetical protein
MFCIDEQNLSIPDAIQGSNTLGASGEIGSMNFWNVAAMIL